MVPPPIRAIGRCPVCCIQYSIIIGSSEPTCNEAAVQSNPMYAVIGDFGRQLRPAPPARKPDG